VEPNAALRCQDCRGEIRVAQVRFIAVRAAHVDAAEAREELLRVAARDREATNSAFNTMHVISTGARMHTRCACGLI
jgi:hypothetical protein